MYIHVYTMRFYHFSQNTAARRYTQCFPATQCSKIWSRISCMTLTTWKCAMRWIHSAGCANRWGTPSRTIGGPVVASFWKHLEWFRMFWNFRGGMERIGMKLTRCYGLIDTLRFRIFERCGTSLLVNTAAKKSC